MTAAVRNPGEPIQVTLEEETESPRAEDESN